MCAALDVRLTEEPVVWSVSTAHLNKLCSFCLKRPQQTEQLQRCAKCRQMHYCSKQCQVNDWTQHKFECKRYAALQMDQLPEWIQKRCPDFPSDGIRVLARLVLHMKHKHNIEQKVQGRCYADVTSHEAEILSSDGSRHMFTDVCQLYAHFIGVPVGDVNKEKLVEHYGKLIINQFAIKDSGLQSVGVGLYLSLSRLQHSCNPTGRIVFDGKRASVIPVTQNSFPCAWLESMESIVENVNHSYIDNLASKQDRQLQLKRQYFFACECSGCNDVQREQSMTSYQCLETQDCRGMVVPAQQHHSMQAEYVCLSCRALASKDDVETAKNIATIAIQAVGKVRDAGNIINAEKKFEVCSKSAAMQEGCLHPLNIHRMLTLRVAFESAVALGRWEDAVKYGDNVMHVYRHYLGAFDPWRASFAVNLAVAYLNCNHKQQAKLLLVEAVGIHEHTFGEGSEPVQYINSLIHKCHQ